MNAAAADTSTGTSLFRGSRLRLVWLLLATASAATLTNYLLDPNRKPMADEWRFGLFSAAWATVFLTWRRHRPYLRRRSGGLTFVVVIGEILVVSAVRNHLFPCVPSPPAESLISASPAFFALTEEQEHQTHALVLAVQRNDAARVQAILVDDDRPDALDCGSEGACTIETPLHLAVAKGEHQIAALLLDHGASATQGDPSPLLEAVSNGDISMMRLLIHHGAPVNDDDTKTNSTALWDAILRGKPESVDYLLKAGASTMTFGPSPLDYQTSFEDGRIRWSALHLARYEGNVAIVKRLTKAGAPE